MNTNDGNQKELNGGFGLCSVLYDRFSNCMTFGGQLRQIHRDGSAENCGDIIMDYSKCLLAQSSQDEKKKKELFLSSNIYQNVEIRPINDILVTKDKPSWE